MTGGPAFPFSAIAGQEAVKRALLLAVVNPAVGGVLLLGEKGTAKTTAVRALAALLPEIEVVAGCPFRCHPDAPAGCCPRCGGGSRDPLPRERAPAPLVELPLCADLERVVGGIRVEAALQEGRPFLEPGLLAAANRGVLYVDEVNLLPDGLADAVLDAAASGVNHVEREGVSFAHPARFLLVGTMNPEEGELRPQLLDRFGLSVAVRGEGDLRLRAEIVRRRVAYEADPAAFVRSWASAEEALRRRLAAARALLPAVRLSEPALARAVELAKWSGAAGHRGEVALAEAARSLAAWQGRTRVLPQDVEAVSDLALSHRLPRRPVGGATPPRSGPGRDAAREASPADGVGGAGGGPPAEGTRPREPVRMVRADAGGTQALPLPASRRGGGRRAAGSWSGRSALVRARSGGGRYVRPVARGGGGLALAATIRVAALRQRGRPRKGVAVAVEPGDLRWKERARRVGSLLLFVVDGSGSMAGRRRMAEARAAVLALLRDAYRKRDRVGLVVFRGQGAEVLLPPTNSVELAQRRLALVAAGGRTPLAAGLWAAAGVAFAHRRSCPGAPVRIIVITDGRANVGLGGDPLRDALRLAGELSGTGLRFLVIDADKRGAHAGSANRWLAEALGAGYVRIEELEAERLLEVVRGWER